MGSFSGAFPSLQWAADGSVVSVWRVSQQHWAALSFLLSTNTLTVSLHCSGSIPYFTIRATSILQHPPVFPLCSIPAAGRRAVAWPQSEGATYFLHFCGNEKVPQILPHFQSYLALAASLCSWSQSWSSSDFRLHIWRTISVWKWSVAGWTEWRLAVRLVCADGYKPEASKYNEG